MQKDKEAMASVNAGLLIARTFVHARLAGDQARYQQVLDRARYCQLLATRLALPHIEAHRIDLAAWVSGMDPLEPIRKRLTAEHRLESVLGSGKKAGQPPGAGRQILDLVETYQKLKEENPSIRDSLRKLQKQLDKQWASSAEQRRMTHALVRILRDEAFLFSWRQAAGKILIVDPEEAVSPVLAPTLEMEGYSVRVASDASTGLEIAEQDPPDLIISELDMPVIGGLHFCRKIRDKSKTARATFMIATGTRGKATVKRCMREGVDEVLGKPIDIEMLFLKLKRFIKPAAPAQAPAGEPRGGVSGSLSDIAFADLVQMLTSGLKTATISLASGGRKAEVVIVKGEVLHARTDCVEGEKAFYELMSWQDGSFETSRSGDVSKRTIDAPVMSLLMEGARLSDEASE